MGVADSKRTILAIVNANAGTAQQQRIDAALTALKQGATVHVEATASPEDLKQALEDHDDVDTVAAVGGDGSLHAVVQALYDADLLDHRNVGLIPLGTGNDFARSVNIPIDPAQAAQVVLDGSAQHLELGTTADGHVIVNAVHAGVGADAAAAGAPLKKILGKLGYAVGSAVAGFTRPGVVVTITVDGEKLVDNERILQVAAGVGRFVGRGAELLPDADPTDGQFDIAISTAWPPLRRLGYTIRLSRGEHQHSADVHYVQGRSITIEGEPTRATNDGELTDPMTRHEWTLTPTGWRLYT